MDTRYGWLGLFLFCGLSQAQIEAPSPDAISDCVSANAPAQSYVGRLELDTSDAEGQVRKLEARLIGQRDDNKLALNIRLLAPSDMAGTTLLLREQRGQDSVEVYLPGLRRSRRVAGAMAEKEIWGTGLSYMDLKQLFGALREGETQLETSEDYLGRPAHRMALNSQDDVLGSEAQIQFWIDQEHCVPLGAESRDSEGTLRKQLQADPASITAIGDRWVVSRWSVDNLERGLRTTAEISDMRFDSAVQPRAFQSTRYHEVP